MTPGEIRRLYFIVHTFFELRARRAYPQNAYHAAASYLAADVVLDA